MGNKTIWIRRDIPSFRKVLWGSLCLGVLLVLWLVVTTAPSPDLRIVSPSVFPHPLEVLDSLRLLILGPGPGFDIKQSLIYSIWLSLSRELIAFLVVVAIALPLGVFMSAHRSLRALVNPLLVIGSFIPIAAFVPLTLATLGTSEAQKIVFLGLGMFFVLTALVIKEMDEVDSIVLQTAYTLGFGQIKTLLLVNLPAALPRIWKHLASVFGLGWGYIIFAEFVKTSEANEVSGIGWIFLVRQRRGEVADMYAVFFTIILLAFLFSFLFKIVGRKLFPHEKD